MNMIARITEYCVRKDIISGYEAVRAGGVFSAAGAANTKMKGDSI